MNLYLNYYTNFPYVLSNLKFNSWNTAAGKNSHYFCKLVPFVKLYLSVNFFNQSMEQNLIEVSYKINANCIF